MSKMGDLFTFGETLPQPNPRTAFDGITYNVKNDHKRLKGQLQRVFELMQDGQWRTLKQIAEVTGGSEASISARCRDLRKTKYGSHEVERQLIGRGLYKYRLIVATQE